MRCNTTIHTTGFAIGHPLTGWRTGGGCAPALAVLPPLTIDSDNEMVVWRFDSVFGYMASACKLKLFLYGRCQHI
jgi:hypothetical protein